MPDDYTITLSLWEDLRTGDFGFSVWDERQPQECEAYQTGTKSVKMED